MSKGKSNYFRHSFLARHDKKLNSFMGLFGRDFRDGYFYFFTLLELCASDAQNGKTEFVHHPSVLRSLWRTSTLGVQEVCSKFTLSELLVCTHSSSGVVFSIPNLKEYTGKYEKERPNKEIKETNKEIKEVAPLASPVLEIVEIKKPRKKNLPKVSPQDFRNPKDSPELFAVEAPSLDEDTELSDLARNAITAMNTICGKSFRPVPGNMKHINARVNEGYKLDDFVSVLKFKQAQWSNDPRMCAYLRPETIFGTKFDSYLQESKNADKPKSDPLDDFFAQYTQPIQEGA